MLRVILLTAFLEGLSVLVVEIAGARALAPYFGTSLHVWTAQITATLLFLAVGYAVGAILCRRGPMALPGVFLGAGAWLALYPVWRTTLLDALTPLGISVGAFVASAALFGPPLTCMGAVSPLLINRIGKAGIEGGRAAGALFFTNTIGGLAGGWLTALVLVPLVPLRYVLAGTGVALAVLGALWTLGRGKGSGVWLVPAACLTLTSLGYNAVTSVPIGDEGQVLRVVDRVQSPTGSITVLELPGVWRSLLINGVNQGAMNIETGTSWDQFSEYMANAIHRYHPNPRTALMLGLGCGVITKRLEQMGMKVTVVELEPEIVKAARKHFGLPDTVRAVAEDGRTFLRTDRGKYDIIILDVFAGENAPWYLLSREGVQAAKERLAPGGRLVVNTVTITDGATEGLARLEAVLLEVFGEAEVFVEPRLPMETDEIINATLVAGEHLQPNDDPFPYELPDRVAAHVGDMNGVGLRRARAGGVIDTDDYSSLEMVDSDLRLYWRESLRKTLPAALLID